MRLPITRQPTSPAMPALMCTTVPPAKSSAPQLNSSPFAASAAFAASIAAWSSAAVASASSVAWSAKKSGPPHHQTMCAIGK